MKAKSKLTVFDVGHGSCVFLEDGAVRTVIDCKDSALFIEYLISQKITVVHQVIISHADADHIAGILALIQSDYVQLGTVFVNADASKDSQLWTLLRLALQDAVTRRKLAVRTEIGDGMAQQLQHDEVQIEVIAPGIAVRLAGPGGKTPQAATARSNALSVVLRLHHRGHPLVLVPGDMDVDGMRDVLARGKRLDCDILIFPHHGGHVGHGASAATKARVNAQFAETIMQQANPKLVLFSNARGMFATPRPEIVREIRAKTPACYIRCTQLSEHCAKEVPVDPATHLMDIPAAGRAENQCCGGSLEIVFNGAATADDLDPARHAAFINAAVPHPLCRG